MKLLSAPAFAALASARVLNANRDANPLDVKLSVSGNTVATLSVTNSGSEPLKIFKTGTILDDREIERVSISQAGSPIEFSGLRLYISPSVAEESAFETIAPGQSVQKSWDIAHGHDLSIGGSFNLAAVGTLSYASPGSTTIAGSIAFKSNVVQTAVDGAQAAAVHVAFQARMKRSVVQSDCNASQKSVITRAMPLCRSRALAAASAANAGNKIVEYFKNNTPNVRSTVVSVFNKLAAECASTTSGFSKFRCSDVGQTCSGGVIAYTSPPNSYMVYCPTWFNQMPDRTSACHQPDKPYVIIHEMTHLSQIKGTDDYGVYGYDAVRRLSAAQNLNHADTYAQYTNAIDLNC